MAMTTLRSLAPAANMPREALHAAGGCLPRHIRVTITDELSVLFDRVDILLARLDASDGDPDLEDDDPGGDHLDERGEARGDDGRGILPGRPLYAIDQTAGPINYAEASSAHLAAQNGLVRSATGGWRHAA